MKTVWALEVEDVQSYPRPPALERVALPLEVVLAGQTIARSVRALRVCETHHPPTYYLPPDDIVAGVLSPVAGRSFCEWKGTARYWDVEAGGARRARAAWSYPAPTPAFAALADHVAFYPGMMDACFVGDQRVVPQPGDFYGGWATPNLTGTIKGGPGTLGW